MTITARFLRKNLEKHSNGRDFVGNKKRELVSCGKKKIRGNFLFVKVSFVAVAFFVVFPVVFVFIVAFFVISVPLSHDFSPLLLLVKCFFIPNGKYLKLPRPAKVF